jgi:ubiquitin-like protein Pup
MAPGGEQSRKGKPRQEEESVPEEKAQTESKGEDVDELLDEIDEVLEVNAEEFVRSFVQKGGQ